MTFMSENGGAVMTSLIGIAGVIFMMAFVPVAGAGEPVRTVFDIAAKRTLPPAAPKPSDVCFSSRWKHPANAKDPHNTFESASAFHATRLDWVYAGGDKAFVSEAKSRGYAFNSAVNTVLTDKLGSRDYKLGRCRDLDGNVIVAPWMTKWGAVWGCANNPDYARIWLEHAKAAVDAGADSLQMDDPKIGASAVSWGGCFCEHCVAGFGRYLQQKTTDARREALGIADAATFDYAAYLRQAGTRARDGFGSWKGSPGLRDLFIEFLRDSDQRFYRNVQSELAAYAGRRVPYSCNGVEELLGYLGGAFDFGMAEWNPLHRGGPAHLYFGAIRKATERGKSIILTCVSTDKPKTRRFVALAYALGSHVIVPWDVYIGPDAPREFGAPEDYADLYGFVRANAALLDGYEDAAVAIPETVDDRYGDAPAVRLLGGSGQVCASVRCLPGQPNTPVAVHLVDWSDQPKPFTLALDPRRLHGDRPVRVRLLTPSAYDKAAHDAAEKTRSYGALSQTRPLPSGHMTMFEIPALNPWGIVVVEPDPAAVKGAWQPAIGADAADCHKDTLRVRVSSASPGATIRYTTDGREPTAASTIYSGPIALAQSATVRARAFVDGVGESAAASASFAKDDTVVAVLPDAAGLKADLRLWLRADALAKTLADGATVTTWSASAGPDAEVRPVKLLSGIMAAPPTFVAGAVNGQPAVRFDGVDDSLAVADFANQHLAGRAFAIFMVTQSADSEFGLCGNALSGSGGLPRLYLMRSAFFYDVLDKPVAVSADRGVAALTTFQHDGQSTASAWLNGLPRGTRSDLPVTKQFGGGHLAMPFWSGNQNRAGDIAELIVFGRALSESERAGVETYLADKYGLPCRARWR